MAKKILAVVLAVMMAVSAMAITAFADQKIDLYPAQTFTRYNANGSLNVSGNSTWHVVDVTFDIPVYALYGWMTQGNALIFTLPTFFGGNMIPYPDDATIRAYATGTIPTSAAAANTAGTNIWTDGVNFYDINQGNAIVSSLLSTIDWSIVVDGKEWALESTGVEQTWNNPTDPDGNGDDSDAMVSMHKVVFGAFGRDYVETDPGDADGDGFDGETTIPQTTVFGSVSNIRLVAELLVPDTWRVDTDHLIYTSSRDLNTALAYYCGVQLVDATGAAVNASNSYITDWNPTVVTDVDVPLDNSYVFVTDEWSTSYLTPFNAFGQLNGNDIRNVAHPITWDHTLANRAIILGAEGETAKLVVELTEPIIGGATYTLWARTELRDMYSTSGDLYNTWWNYDGSRKYIAECKVDGKAETLEFDVPVSALYDATGYGTYNTEFVIFENITLFNDKIMKDYLHFDAGYDGYGNTNSSHAINLSMQGAGSVGRLSWANNDRVRYDGEQVRYAAGGASEAIANYNLSPVASQAADSIPAEATAMYLLFPEAAQEEVKAPTEPPETEEDEPQGGDDMNVADEPAEEPKADENPKTGLALAVVPMMIAAAAAVVSKKH